MRIVVLSDTHYAVKPCTQDSTLWNRQLLTSSAELGELLQKQLRKLAPDLVIHCGDLTHDGDLESLRFAHQIFSSLPCQFEFTLGNHDTAIPEARERIAEIFGLSRKDFSYRVDLPEFSVLFLDTNFAHLSDGSESPLMNWRRAKEDYAGVGPSTASLAWLAQELRELAGRPVILIAHHPFIVKEHYPALLPRNVQDWRKRVGPVDKALLPVYYQELQQIVSENAGTIKAIFTGHWHINECFKWRGIQIMQVASLTELPFEFRLFELNGRTLSGTVQQLDCGDTGMFARSYVQEWGNTFMAGTRIDREVEIML